MRFNTYRTARFFLGVKFIVMFSIAVESAVKFSVPGTHFTLDSLLNSHTQAENFNLKASSTFSHLNDDTISDSPIRGMITESESSASNEPQTVRNNDLTPHPSIKDEIESKLLSLQSRISSKTFELLSTKVLSEVDPFQYLFRETINISQYDILKIIAEVKFVLKTAQLPDHYIPYVQALKSILSSQIALASARKDILEMQKNPSANSDARSSIPSNILSPPELSGTGLFSAEIFSDPEPPLRLLNKLLSIPKENIPNLLIRLKNFTKRVEKSEKYIPSKLWPYIWYAHCLVTLFKEEYVLDDLKRDMSTLQRTHEFITAQRI